MLKKEKKKFYYPFSSKNASCSLVRSERRQSFAKLGDWEKDSMRVVCSLISDCMRVSNSLSSFRMLGYAVDLVNRSGRTVQEFPCTFIGGLRETGLNMKVYNQIGEYPRACRRMNRSLRIAIKSVSKVHIRLYLMTSPSMKPFRVGSG